FATRRSSDLGHAPARGAARCLAIVALVVVPPGGDRRVALRPAGAPDVLDIRATTACADDPVLALSLGWHRCRKVGRILELHHGSKRASSHRADLQSFN